jgi:hypothetical protein
MSYQRIVFLIDSEALPALEILGEKGVHDVIQYLAQWDNGDTGNTYTEPASGSADTVFIANPYRLTYNLGLGYIGLERWSTSVKRMIFNSQAHTQLEYDIPIPDGFIVVTDGHIKPTDRFLNLSRFHEGKIEFSPVDAIDIKLKRRVNFYLLLIRRQ